MENGTYVIRGVTAQPPGTIPKRGWVRLALTKFWRQYRSELLMWVLIGEVLASPVADQNPRAGAFLAILIFLAVLAAASFMANRRIVRQVVIPIACVWLVARVLEEFGNPRYAYAHLAPIAGLALSISALWAIVERQFSPHDAAKRDCGSLHQLPHHRDGIFPALLDFEPPSRQPLQSADSGVSERHPDVLQHGHSDQRRLRLHCACESLRAHGRRS